MKAFSFYLYTFITFCLLQSAPALECYQCSDIPGFPPNSTTCRSGKLGKTTCKGILGPKCYTAKLKKFGLSVVVRDCAIGDVCAPEFQDSPCKIIKNITRVDSCDLKCCSEDLCDPSSADRPSFPSVLAASCATILWAFFFNIFT